MFSVGNYLDKVLPACSWSLVASLGAFPLVSSGNSNEDSMCRDSAIGSLQFVQAWCHLALFLVAGPVLFLCLPCLSQSELGGGRSGTPAFQLSSCSLYRCRTRPLSLPAVLLSVCTAWWGGHMVLASMLSPFLN
eukprot:1157232-Pelagomonas_calceolata.AAC.1